MRCTGLTGNVMLYVPTCSFACSGAWEPSPFCKHLTSSVLQSVIHLDSAAGRSTFQMVKCMQAPDLHHVTTLPFSRGSTSSGASSGRSGGSRGCMNLSMLPVSVSDADQRVIRHKLHSFPRCLRSGSNATKQACKGKPAPQQAFSSTRMSLQTIPTEQDRFGRWVFLCSVLTYIASSNIGICST